MQKGGEDRTRNMCACYNFTNAMISAWLLKISATPNISQRQNSQGCAFTHRPYFLQSFLLSHNLLIFLFLLLSSLHNRPPICNNPDPLHIASVVVNIRNVPRIIPGIIPRIRTIIGSRPRPRPFSFVKERPQLQIFLGSDQISPLLQHLLAHAIDEIVEVRSLLNKVFLQALSSELYGIPPAVSAKRYARLAKRVEREKLVVAEGTAAVEVIVVVGTEVLVVQDSDFRCPRAGSIGSWILQLVDVDVICSQVAMEAGKRLRKLGPRVAWDALIWVVSS